MKKVWLIAAVVLLCDALSAQSSLPGNLRPSGSNTIKTAPTDINMPADDEVENILESAPLELLNGDSTVIRYDTLPKPKYDTIPKRVEGTVERIQRPVDPVPTYQETEQTRENEAVYETPSRRNQYRSNRIRAGSFRVGTTSDLNFLKLEEDTITGLQESAGLNLNIDFGIFVANNVELTLLAGYANQQQAFQPELIRLDYGAGVRFYIAGKVFGGASMNWVRDDQPVFGNPLIPIPLEIETVESRYLRYYAGYAGFFNRFIAFEPQIFWTEVLNTTNAEHIRDTFGFRMGLGIYFQRQ